MTDVSHYYAQYSRREALVKRYYTVVAVLGFIVLCLVPALQSNYINHVLIQILLFAYLGQSWNIMCGYSGQMSFGHAAFYGIGAYASTILFMQFGLSPWLGMLVGGCIAAAVGLFIGGVTLRYGLQSAYFAFFTLTASEIVRLIALGWDSLTNGAEGLMLPLVGNQPLNYIFDVQHRYMYYYVILIMYVLVTCIALHIKRTRLGYHLAAVKGEQAAATMLGVNAYRVKMIVFGLSAFLTALGGTFYAQYFQHFDPDIVLNSMQSFEIIFPVIIGGGGNVFGSFVGSIVLQGGEEITRALMPTHMFGMHRIVYGLLVVGMLMFLPKGLMSIVDGVIYKRVSRRMASEPKFLPDKPDDRGCPAPNTPDEPGAAASQREGGAQ